MSANVLIGRVVGRVGGLKLDRLVLGLEVQQFVQADAASRRGLTQALGLFRPCQMTHALGSHSPASASSYCCRHQHVQFGHIGEAS